MQIGVFQTWNRTLLFVNFWTKCFLCVWVEKVIGWHSSHSLAAWVWRSLEVWAFPWATLHWERGGQNSACPTACSTAACSLHSQRFKLKVERHLILKGWFLTILFPEFLSISFNPVSCYFINLCLRIFPVVNLKKLAVSGLELFNLKCLSTWEWVHFRVEFIVRVIVPEVMLQVRMKEIDFHSDSTTESTL